MDAKVTKAFPGVPDGETQTRTIEEGAVITGDLAAVAVRERWAKPIAALRQGDPEVEKPEGAALIDAIARAVPDLDPKEDYTRDDVPGTAALARALGYPVSAAERDAGFAKWREVSKDGRLPLDRAPAIPE